MTRRSLSAEERALWRAAMRDVAPREEAAATAEPAAPPPPDAPAPRRKAAPRAPRADAPPRLPELNPGAAPGLDRRSAERLRRGQKRIEARLDLHGMTQDDAHRSLDDFLARADEAGRRCVLVITGKGAVGRGGVLRSAVPRWLNEQPNRARILAFAPAQARDGGGGALYILLRRRR
jgi:DNA-nicking Smr family endonuclease